MNLWARTWYPRAVFYSLPRQQRMNVLVGAGAVFGVLSLAKFCRLQYLGLALFGWIAFEAFATGHWIIGLGVAFFMWRACVAKVGGW